MFIRSKKLFNIVTRTVYSFGSQCDNLYGQMVLMPDGSIEGYHHPNENSWKLSGNEILFFAADGTLSRRFKSDGRNNWIGRSEGGKWPFFLLELLSLKSINTNEKFPKVFVNSVPKSGTYFMEATLRKVGVMPTNLHVLDNGIIDDYRDVPEEEMHVRPHDLRFKCPTTLITKVMKDGETLVGHIADFDTIKSIRAQGVCIISLIRNLRNVLVSLYRFKLNKVLPIDDGDRYWRKLSDDMRFVAFLIYFNDKDIRNIREMAKTFSNDRDGILLRYEDMLKGELTEDIAGKLDRYHKSFSEKISRALVKRKDSRTSTFSGVHSDWRKYWSDEAEEYFRISGLYEINKRFGYEP